MVRLLAFLGLAATSVMAISTQGFAPTRKCGTTHTLSADLEAEAQKIVSNWKSNSANRVQAAATKSVGIYWHTITSGSTGALSSTAINNQINVLNQDYANYGFSFYLINTTT